MKITRVSLAKGANLIFVDSDKSLPPCFNTKDKSETLSELTSSELCQLLDGLIARLKDTDAPNEEEGIVELSLIVIQELKGRLRDSEDKKTQRNKLIRYLRKELGRLTKPR